MAQSLQSLPAGASALVVGATGGIGAAFLDQLLAERDIARVHAWARQPADMAHEKLISAQVDICDEASIAAAAHELPASVHLVIVATGILHDGEMGPEKSWRALDADWLARNFAVNTIGPALIAKHVLARFPKRERAIFAAISARVGSIGDNRLGGWYGYRAAKAGLNQIIKTLSIELQRTHPEAVCVGLHPGTVDTDLSAPFQRNVDQEKLFTPQKSATHLLGVLDGLTPDDSGRVFAWDGKPVPY